MEESNIKVDSNPMDNWKPFFALLRKGELEKAKEYFSKSPIESKMLTQILFKCIDGFGDDQKLSDIVEFLIEKGADVSARRGEDFKSSLHLALLRNKIISAGVIVSRLDMASRREKLSRLLLKIMEEVKEDTKRADIVAFLLEHGADVNIARQTDLMTPLHIEMQRTGLTNCGTRTMEVLFANKADTEAKNCEGKVPQDSALSAVLDSLAGNSSGKVGVMWGSDYKRQKSPLQKMIDALPQPKAGVVVEPIKAMQLIAELDDCEVRDIVEQLKYSNNKAYKLFSGKFLNCGKSGPINKAVKTIEKELNVAWLRCCESVRQGKEQILKDIEFLIQCGADTNCQEPETGKTLLHYAVERGDEKLAALLKSFGASIDIPSKPFGVTVRQMEAERNQASPNPIIDNVGPVRYGQAPERKG